MKSRITPSIKFETCVWRGPTTVLYRSNILFVDVGRYRRTYNFFLYLGRNCNKSFQRPGGWPVGCVGFGMATDCHHYPPKKPRSSSRSICGTEGSPFNLTRLSFKRVIPKAIYVKKGKTKGIKTANISHTWIMSRRLNRP